MLEQCRNCLGFSTHECPLESFPPPKQRSQFFETEIGKVFQEFERSRIFVDVVQPMVCEVENKELSPNQRHEKFNRISSTVFAELAYIYVRDHMSRLGFEVLSPKFTEDVFDLTGQSHRITPDGLVVKRVDDGRRRIVGVCEYTMSKKPAYIEDKKAQGQAYRTGNFLKFFNHLSMEKRESVSLAIWRETGCPEPLSFVPNDYWGAILGVTKDPSTERSLEKLGLKGFEHRIPIYRVGLEQYVHHLIEMLRQPIYV